MLKQILAIVVLSILVIVTMSYAQQLLQFLVSGHDWIAQTLTEVFSGGQAGNLIRNLLALLAIPLLASLLPVLIYWLAKRQLFPYFMHMIWVIWLVQTAALIVLYKAVS